MTLIEVGAAMTLVVIGFVALAGVVSSVGRGDTVFDESERVLLTAQSLLEEIRGTSPEEVAQNFDGRFFAVEGVAGDYEDETVITVVVDDSEPKLLLVTIRGSWSGRGERDLLSTYVFHAKG